MKKAGYEPRKRLPLTSRIAIGRNSWSLWRFLRSSLGKAIGT